MVELLNTNEEETLDDRVTTIKEEDADGNYVFNQPQELFSTVEFNNYCLDTNDFNKIEGSQNECNNDPDDNN